MTGATWPTRRVGFPMSLDDRGQTRLVDDDTYLRGVVEHLLFTRPGERVNRPDVGSGVDVLVFAPGGDELAQATRSLVHAALQRHLGDLLRVDDVTVESDESTLTVTVVYAPLRSAADDPRRVLRVSSDGRSGS